MTKNAPRPPDVRFVPTMDGGPVPALPHRDLDELELRSLVLRALYDVRRGRPYKPSLSLLVLSELAGCSIESLQYTLWYLRGKHYIDTTDDSDVMITVDGVDYLEANALGLNGFRPGEGSETPIALPLSCDATGAASLAPTVTTTAMDRGTDRNGRWSAKALMSRALAAWRLALPDHYAGVSSSVLTSRS
jgi:hypothetical protein